MAGMAYSVGSACAYRLTRQPLFFFLQEAVDLFDQLQQLLRVLLICGFRTQMLPTFSGFALHGMGSACGYKAFLVPNAPKVKYCIYDYMTSYGHKKKTESKPNHAADLLFP